jgi:hypothetical protein
MKKDKRQIHLEPMEWRDAMRGVAGEARTGTAAGATKKAAKPAAKKKPARTRFRAW